MRKSFKKDLSLTVFIVLLFTLFLFITRYNAIRDSSVTAYSHLKARKIFNDNIGYGEKKGVTINNPAEVYPGTTILTAFGGHLDGQGNLNHVILVNNEGKIINEWPMDGSPAKFLPGGYVIGGNNFKTVYGNETHQEGTAIVELNWQKQAVWQFNNWENDSSGTTSAKVHHDLQRGNNPVGFYYPQASTSTALSGNTLVLAHKTINNSDISPLPLEDDVIYEVTWDKKIIWKWVASEHFSEFGFTDDMRNAIRGTKIINNGSLTAVGYPNTAVDWLHMNTISYVGDNIWYRQGDQRFAPDNIIISSRNACFTAIIEKSTGKIVWRLGPDYQNGQYGEIGQIIGQHDPYIIPPGLPGEGDLILFDNGGFSCYGSIMKAPVFPANFRDYSRVLEINPKTLQVVWEYEQTRQDNGQVKFFSWVMGSAQRLPNGNTLIAEGATGRIFEVTNEKKIVWEFYSPYRDDKSTCSSNLGSFIYSVYRVPNEWLPTSAQTK